VAAVAFSVTNSSPTSINSSCFDERLGDVLGTDETDFPAFNDDIDANTGNSIRDFRLLLNTAHFHLTQPVFI